MTPALARRRAAKAQRRKTQVALKQREDRLDASLPGQVRRAAAGPIQCCIVQEGLFERGNGVVMLARMAPDGTLVMASFLLDVHCLGIKNVMLAPIGPDALDAYVAALGNTSAWLPAEPAYARKLVRETAAFARSIGFEPHREFAAAERLFGDVRTETCDARFAFGLDGKPCYAPGPGETAGQIGRRVQQLARRLGPDGFDVMMPAETAASSLDAPSP
jgi:hypothetical protein